MSSIRYMKRNDTKPFLYATLSLYIDNDTSTSLEKLDLTGASVKFIMRKDNTVTPKIEQILSEVEIIDAEEGSVMYRWQPGDTDTPGEYLAEFEVTDVDGYILTIWDLRSEAQIQKNADPAPLRIVIVEDLG